MRFASFTPARVNRSAPSTFSRCVVWSSLNVAPSVSYYGNVKVAQIGGGHGGRRTLVESARGRRLRECDDVTKRRRAGDEHRDAIEAECDTPVRRCAGA